jgi:hypothetical protein
VFEQIDVIRVKLNLLDFYIPKTRHQALGFLLPWPISFLSPEDEKVELPLLYCVNVAL